MLELLDAPLSREGNPPELRSELRPWSNKGTLTSAGVVVAGHLSAFAFALATSGDASQGPVVRGSRAGRWSRHLFLCSLLLYCSRVVETRRVDHTSFFLATRRESFPAAASLPQSLLPSLARVLRWTTLGAGSCGRRKNMRFVSSLQTKRWREATNRSCFALDNLASTSSCRRGERSPVSSRREGGREGSVGRTGRGRTREETYSTSTS